MADREDHVERMLFVNLSHMPERHPSFEGTGSIEYEDGYIVAIAPGDEIFADEWIRPVIAEAFKKDCNWISFDCDAEEFDGLKTYRWECNK